ncbi:MAG: hypothetical protein LAN84_04180 [Acidobacteriia bacterium]|nr:hypothetical protein [Terriglobia bacterium]
MNPATSQTSDNLRKQIGPAVWLLLLLLRFVPAEWTGDEPAWVVGGSVVADAELAERLEVSPAVITKWRLRLRKLGLLGWLVSPGRGRAFWVAGVNRVLGGGEKPASQEAAKQTAALPAGPAAEVWRVIQERSIALTGKVVEDLTAAEGAQLAKVLARGSEIVGERRPE